MSVINITNTIRYTSKTIEKKRSRLLLYWLKVLTEIDKEIDNEYFTEEHCFDDELFENVMESHIRTIIRLERLLKSHVSSEVLDSQCAAHGYNLKNYRLHGEYCD